MSSFAIRIFQKTCIQNIKCFC